MMRRTRPRSVSTYSGNLSMTRRNEYEEIRVLIVDDDRFMLSLIKTILQSLGFKDIIDVTDAADAFKAIKQLIPDLIITDWEMSPLDGLDLIRMIRKAGDSPNNFIPIILLTAHTEVKRITEARDAGVNEVVAKPISAAVLGKRIDSVINHPRSFIRTDTYFGPDRRRQNLGPPRGKRERRHDQMAAAAQTAEADDMAEIQALLGKK